MDLFSHALLPYLFGSFVHLDKKQIAASVLGGIASDLDVFIIWINYFYPTSMLVVHRGFTHSFFFGFFTVLVLLYLASRNPFKVLFQKFFHFNLSISFLTIAFACSGLISHLFLDFLTTRGVPLFYPWDAARYSAEIFFTSR